LRSDRLRRDAPTSARRLLDRCDRCRHPPGKAAIHRGKRLAFADCDTIESAYAAQEAGADFVSTTLAGYTEATRGLDPDGPAFATLRQMVEELRVPVVAEGRLKAPWQVQVALQIGAKAVVVGGALNDPVKQTRDFRALVPRSKALLAVDIGGTWTRAALFHGWKLVESWRISTSEVVDRRAWILEQTCDVGVDTVAISSGGTVDPVALEVVEANEIIPGTYVGTTFVLPDANVVALNDGLATAWGHACLPQYAGRRVATLTLGTGLGFGFVANGQIHMGDRGEYARLNDLAGPSGPSFEEVLAGNQRFPPEVRREAAQRAVAAIRNLFFPDAIVLSGGVGLHEDLGLELPSSPFGEDAGLYGAAALALFPPANLPRATRGSL